MPTTKKTTPTPPSAPAVIAELRRLSSKSVRDGMSRYAIPSDKAFGVSVGKLRQFAKRLGKNHELALHLWQSGWYEGRMLATFVDDPDLVTAAQMDKWARDFDSWAICDTACFSLFARTPHAWKKVTQWAKRDDEFIKRAAYALLASLCLHDKEATDVSFKRGLVLIEKAAKDDRNFVKKGVNWALRCIGKRNASLNAAAIKTARRLAASEHPATRWVGKDALRDLTAPALAKRLTKRGR